MSPVPARGDGLVQTNILFLAGPSRFLRGHAAQVAYVQRMVRSQTSPGCKPREMRAMQCVFPEPKTPGSSSSDLPV